MADQSSHLIAEPFLLGPW